MITNHLGEDSKRLQMLIDALQMADDDSACETCLDLLPEYVQTQVLGGDYLSDYPETAVHLDSCLECTAAYTHLYEMEIAVSHATLPETQPQNSPDLSFLSISTATFTNASISELLHEAIHRAGNVLSLALSPNLLSLLQPQPVPSTLRSPNDSERYAEIILELSQTDATSADLPLTLTAYRDAENVTQCLLEVTVIPPGRSWPDLEGFTVYVKIGEQQWEASTDAWGLASFEGIPVSGLARLQVEVKWVS